MMPSRPPIDPIHATAKGTAGSIKSVGMSSGTGTGCGTSSGFEDVDGSGSRDVDGSGSRDVDGSRSGGADGSGSGVSATARGARWHQTCSRIQRLNRFMVTCCVVRHLQVIRYAHSTGGSDGKSLAVDGSEEKERGKKGACQRSTNDLLWFKLAFC